MSDADIMAKSYAKDAAEAMEESLQEEKIKPELPSEEPVNFNDNHPSLSPRFDRKHTPGHLVTGSILNNFQYGQNSKLSCRFCGKTFSQAGYIKAHERLHTGEKPFACSICGKRFSDPSNWKKHERVHSNQLNRGSPVPSPPKATPPATPTTSTTPTTPILQSTPTNEELHFSQSPMDDERMEKERSMMIRAASSLITSSIQQRMKQEGNTPVICKICGKLFSSQSSLSTHKRIHTGERPYSCRSCGKSFTQIGTLRTHERIHTGEKPYICKICGRTFAQSGSYRMHERRHMTDAIQRCHICYATFTRWQDLQQHMASHPQVTESVRDYATFSPMDLLTHKHDLKDEMRSSQIHEGVLIDDLPYHSQAQSLFQNPCQLPPFSSIMPFRTTVGTTFSPSFPPAPLGMYSSAANLALAESSELGMLRPHYFPSLSLAPQLKIIEQSPAQENEVVSTTGHQSRKDGTISSPLVSTPEAMDTGLKHDYEVELDLSQGRNHQSESSDGGSQSPGAPKNNGEDSQTLSIERQNLNTRMIPSSSNGRKQRHPMRRCSSSASSDQELPQSTSSLPMNGATDLESPKDEDQALVSYLLWKGKVYKCEHCHMIFEDCTLYLLHNGFHSHDSDPFKCVICKVSCKDRIDFNCHLTSHIK